jgi:RNA recognition motif-containing protein
MGRANDPDWPARIFVGGMKQGRPSSMPIGEKELRDIFGRYGGIKNIKSGK